MKFMRKKKISALLLTIVMVIPLIIPKTSIVLGAEDTVYTIIKSLSLSNNKVTVNDTITITVDVNTDKNINYIIIKLTNGSSEKSVHIKKNSNGDYIGTLTIDKEYLNGRYEISSIYIEDNEKNIFSTYNPYSTYTNMYFEVTGASSDTDAPVLNSLSIDVNTVTVGDMVTITAEIYDENEIEHFGLNFINENVNKYIYPKKQSDGSYKVTFEIDENYVNGKWELYWINIKDAIGNNYLKINATDIYPTIYFEVTGASSDTKPPEVKSLTVNKESVINGDTITFVADLYDENEIQHFGITLSNGNDIKYIFPKKQSDGLYKGSITIDSSYKYGRYDIQYISIKDNIGNSDALYAFGDEYPGIGFVVFPSGEYKEIEPIKDTIVFEQNTIINNKLINGDVYIGPSAIVTMNSVTVKGNIYVIGALKVNSLNADGIIANRFRTGSTSQYYNGDVYWSGKCTISKMTATDEILDDIPIRVDGNIISTNGLISMKGAVANIAEMYVNDIKVDNIIDGRFVVNNIPDNGKEKVTIRFTTVFGQNFTKDYYYTKCVKDKDTTHYYSTEWTVDKEATCIENGAKSHHCVDCDSCSDVIELPALGHTESEPEIVKVPSYTETGMRITKCTVCNEIVKEEELPIKELILGDTNDDKVVDIKDSALIKRYLAGVDVELDLIAADVNGDGEVTIKDSALIKRQLAGWE